MRGEGRRNVIRLCIRRFNISRNALTAGCVLEKRGKKKKRLLHIHNLDQVNAMDFYHFMHEMLP